MAYLRNRRHHRVSVSTYLIGAFGVCALSLVLVAVQSTRISFERERERAWQDLRMTTRDTQESAASASAELVPYLNTFASDPKVRSLDPAQCDLACNGLTGILTTEHVHVFRADGTQVCAAYGKAAQPVSLDLSGWFGDVIDRGESK